MSGNKKWTAAAKFEIALLAIKGETTLNEICKRYQVAPSQVHAWRKQVVDQGAQLFGKADKTLSVVAEHERTTSTLYEKIGQLTMERDFLKKVWSKLPGNNGGL